MGQRARMLLRVAVRGATWAASPGMAAPSRARLRKARTVCVSDAKLMILFG